MVVVPELVEVCSVLVVEKIEVKRFLFSSKKSHNDMTGRAVRSWKDRQFLETTDCTQILLEMCFWARNAHNILLLTSYIICCKEMFSYSERGMGWIMEG